MDDHLTLFERHRPLLFSIAYRMLGTVTDAEDVMQDAYLRFLSAQLDGVASPKAYLSTIVTRLCMNQLTSGRAKREQYVGPWLPEPVPDADHPELLGPEARAIEAESLSLAFLVLLERLTPAERAAFLLREVFHYEYHEISQMLGRSEASCRQLFHRARDHVAANRPRFQVNPETHRRLLNEFARAVRQGDLGALTAILADDAILWADGGGKAPGATVEPIRGRARVSQFLIAVTARFLTPEMQLLQAQVNGKPTLLARRADGTPFVVVGVDADATGIRTIWAIGNPDKLKAV